MKIQNLLMVILLLVAAGCNTTPSTPTETVTVTDSPSSLNQGMLTHVDARSGVAFDYPSDWYILEAPVEDAVIYSYSVASYDMTNRAGMGRDSTSGVPVGETKIDITFFGAEETPDSARRSIQADVDSGFAIVSKEETRKAADGSDAYYYEIRGRLGGNALVLFTSIDGHTVSVVAYGEGANFEAIIKSLRKA
ncbi:MAG: hypothetical protein GC179_11310 [Anaerolineaceae bacterium]|nr:hypothetical protein [Anaerolineaceae bacterium]